MDKAFILCQLVEGMSNETGLCFLSTHSSISAEGPVCALYWAEHPETALSEISAQYPGSL